MAPSTDSTSSIGVPVDLAGERAALRRALAAVDAKLERLGQLSVEGADALSEEYISAVVRGAVDQLQHELVVFGRIDDEHVWRIGLYGIDAAGEQLVVDWRAPFSEGFYQAGFGDPRGLARRVSYVGHIDDLLVEDFVTGTVAGSSPLMAELSRSRGEAMRTAVATLQSDQDRLVRLDPTARLVLRGGPGTGKTVVGLHRAAWLVYNDRRITADRILVIGPSDRFLRFVAAVLPTLGEARIAQTTFERLLGPASAAGGDERWLGVLDRLEDRLFQPGEVRVGHRRVADGDVAELMDRLRGRDLSWRDRRRIFVDTLAARLDRPAGEVSDAATKVWPRTSAAQVGRRLRNRRALLELDVDRDLVDEWLAGPEDGALTDEVRSRFEGVRARYAHVIVDEAQDLTLLQARAVQRRADGLTLVGDDAQRRGRHGIGLRRAAALLDVGLEQMDTAYRMSAEIAEWLNRWAERHGIDAVPLVGIRPTGVDVRATTDGMAARRELEGRWANVATITAEDVWVHKGIEYDGVVVDGRSMDPSEVYLAASRAAHELVVTNVQ
jgi:hypothetical protein